MKTSKGTKHKNRIKFVEDDKLEKLYMNMDFICQDCMFDCKSFSSKKDIEDCPNRKQRESLNEIIEIIKSENINLTRFCEDYNLKVNILRDMLKGNMILSYKYYWTLCDRMGMVKDNIEINKEYQSLFNKDGDCIG